MSEAFISTKLVLQNIELIVLFHKMGVIAVNIASVSCMTD